MLESPHKAVRRHPIRQTNDDTGFSDRAWTLPHRVDLASALNINTAGQRDIVVTHVVRKSPGHFGRSFRTSVGCAPHRWLLRQRVERAKHLMLTTDHPLSDIALDVGFADQSHFTRVFSPHLGATPGVWRRVQAA